MSISILQLLADSVTQRAATTRDSTLPISDFISAGSAAMLFLGGGIVLYLLVFGRRKQTWSPPRVPDRNASLPLWVIAAAMVWCFLAVPGLFAMRSTATSQPISDRFQAIVYASTILIGLLAAISLHFAFRKAHTHRMLGISRPKPQLALHAIVAASIAVPATLLANVLALLVLQWLQIDHASTHAMLQQMQRNESTPLVLFLTIVNAVMLAPVFEETLFRGHLQTALTCVVPRWGAIVLTSLLFASIHDAWSAPAIFVLSLCIGVAYEWTGSLWVAIFIHVAFNAISTVTFLVGR